ncbi:ribosome-associated translation inhibitor RaiA [Orbaceae bacterium ESL0721]|nr:ribosome-associated translation inhibitor RaiA [Orbaceae bacterium ESL0721]
MTLQVTGKNIEITTAIHQCVEEKLAKLDKWKTELTNPKFILSKEHGIYTVESSVDTPNSVLNAEAKNSDVMVAINEAVKKMEVELNKLHHKPDARRTIDSEKYIQRQHEIDAEYEREKGDY